MGSMKILITGAGGQIGTDLIPILLARGDDFLETLARAMLTYALGRELGLADEAAVKQIVDTTAAGGSTLRALIHAIAASKPFQTT